MMLTILTILLLITNIVGIFLILKDKSKKIESVQPAQQPIFFNTKPLENAIADLPTKVLNTITGSTNTYKGALGELIGYIQLRASYDRIIPLGNIVDFICIKLPSTLPDGTKDPGHIDFIDIKTGDSSRLSKDQRGLQKIIEEKHINFIKMKIDIDTNENTSS